MSRSLKLSWIAVCVVALLAAGNILSSLGSGPPAHQVIPVLFGAGSSQYSLRTVDGTLRPVGYRQLASLGSATSIPTVSGAELVMIQAEGQNLRFRDDKIAPTTSVGFQIFAGDSLWYNAADLTDGQLIEESASGKANLLFYSY